MKKNVRNWLVGTGVLAAGAAAIGAATRTASRYMVRMAMDREGPGKLDDNIQKISGNMREPELVDALEQAKVKLESAGCTPVEIRAEDGITLVGHWQVCSHPKRILIAMHGWRSCWSRDFGLIADFWQENGCSVLYAEQRAHGESGGEYLGFGMLERHDCKSWIRWVCENNPEKLPVYLVGISMGASTVLMTGGMELPECVRGIIADCGFTSAQAIWKHVAEENLHLHYGLYARSADSFCKKKICIGAADCSTVDAMAECEVPVLFVHGTDDSFVPVSMTYENYKACKAPKRLLIVPGAEHGMSFCVDPEGYKRAMLEFWRDYDEEGVAREEDIW